MGHEGQTTHTRPGVAVGAVALLFIVSGYLLAWAWRWPYPDLYASWATLLGSVGMVAALPFGFRLVRVRRTDRAVSKRFTVAAVSVCLTLTALLLLVWAWVPNP